MGDASKQKRSREGLQTGNACRSDARKECQPMACFGALRAIGTVGRSFGDPRAQALHSPPVLSRQPCHGFEQIRA